MKKVFNYQLFYLYYLSLIVSKTMIEWVSE